MATTTNFGWETPDDTDLVKDGAAAMRTLGNSIDASFVDLKGGTTGQILSKASNSDLDYAWITNDVGDITAVTAGTGISGGGTSGAVTITNSMATAIDAKGDLIAGTGADTFDRLAVGTNGQALLADSTTSTGLKWGSVASNKSFSLINSGGTALTGAQTVTYSGLSGYDTYLITIEGASSASASSSIGVRFNGDTAGNYGGFGVQFISNSAYSTGNMSGQWWLSESMVYIGIMSGTASSTVGGAVYVTGANSSGAYKITQSTGAGTVSGSNSNYGYIMNGFWNSASTISSISVFSSSGNFDAGTLRIYGAA